MTRESEYDPVVSSRDRIYLSPPFQEGAEGAALEAALRSNWIAPLGPEVDAFEKEICEAVSVGHGAALSSGTAALHLAGVLLGIAPGDEVLCPTLTFAATAFPFRYLGATLTFIDASEASWTIDPGLVEEELSLRSKQGRLPAAVVTVDLYGQCCDYDPIVEACAQYGVPIVEDAAEALGATYGGRPAGGFGRIGVFSFNGNKLITTSGGGMLVSDEHALVEEARRLATQARDPAPHYEHSTIGYNYRLSNLLAAVGRVQLGGLSARLERRRAVYETYFQLLSDLPGLEFMPSASYGEHTRWLTCITLDPSVFGATREEVRLALEAENIESRPVWKPMHLQPVFGGSRMVGGGVAEKLFARGLCLPSGMGLRQEDIQRVAGIIRSKARCELEFGC